MINLNEDQIKEKAVELGLILCDDWRGLDKDDGSGPDPHSPDRAREVFGDPEYGDFLEFVHECGQNISAHAAGAKDDAVKNSPPASDS